MSCPDWRRLAGHRLAAPGSPEAEEPAAWEAALAHLDACPACRARALAEDPVLVFRRLSALEAGPAAAEAMKAGVAALRRAHRVEGGRQPAARPAAGGAGARGRWWGRAAAAAVLAGALLAVAPAAERSESAGSRELALRSRPWGGAGLVPVAFLEDPTLPAVDDIDHPTASVYHFDDQDVELVMVVDAGLDV
ncbi:MAG TPA: hypothetical protein VJG13_04145 [Thermoanaerobaculia bacterium]|nr:hypothetical protein [Thermoanaerobaculia bacterium]